VPIESSGSTNVILRFLTYALNTTSVRPSKTFVTTTIKLQSFQKGMVYPSAKFYFLLWTKCLCFPSKRRQTLTTTTQKATIWKALLKSLRYNLKYIFSDHNNISVNAVPFDLQGWDSGCFKPRWVLCHSCPKTISKCPTRRLCLWNITQRVL